MGNFNGLIFFREIQLIKKTLKEEDRNSHIKNGEFFKSYNMSVEYTIFNEKQDSKVWVTKLQQIRTNFKLECKNRYTKFQQSGNIFSLIAHDDNEMIDLIKGLFS